jgi:hypothetical protein
VRKNKESKKHVIRHGRADIVNMWLDRYDEIFSDFDPSPYSHRIISNDFISEVKKIYSDKNDYIKELNLYLPENLRNGDEEEIISKRLHSFFEKKLQDYETEFKQTGKKGIMFSILGVMVLTTITYLLSEKTFSGIMQFVFIVAEPAGWFLIWMGLDDMFFTNKPKKPDMEFYKELSGAEISFHSTLILISKLKLFVIHSKHKNLFQKT